MYKPDNFTIQELVPQRVYFDRGNKAWELLDDRLLIALDEMREKFGPIIINTWHSERLQAAYKLREWAGLRTEESPDGTRYSQHRFGRAADCLLPQFDVAEARSVIYEGKISYITAVEEASWLHVDVRNCTPIKKFRP